MWLIPIVPGQVSGQLALRGHGTAHPPHTLSLVRVACVGLQETPPLLEDSHQKFGNSWESPGMRAFEVRGQTTLLALLHTGLFSLPDTVPKGYSCYW